jgi:hypothetical protein
LGIFRNYFGSRCIFIRKDAFSRLADICEGGRADHADWEFLARAALIGLRLEVVPRPLVWYRVPNNSELCIRHEYYDHLRAVTPYSEAMPIPLRDLPKAALTMKLHYERQYGLANTQTSREALRQMMYDRRSLSDKSGGLSLLSDEELALLLVKRRAAHRHDRMASLLSAWLDYSSARAKLPARRLERIPLIARQLLKGRYHRFSHGFGSALRDLRKLPMSADPVLL